MALSETETGLPSPEAVIQEWSIQDQVNFESLKPPAATIMALENYYKYRIPQGEFVTAVLENNLKEACCKADWWNMQRIWHTACWCYNHLPSNCWGSAEKVRAWLNGGDVT